MKFEIRSYSHSVGEFNFHIQFTAAYRKPIFSDVRVLKLTRAYLLEKALSLNVNVKAIEFGRDHVHIFVINCKNIAPAKLIQQLKGFSSRMMRKRHWNLFRHHLWGNKFWSEGYFCRSIGATTTDTVKYYIEKSQQKHWEKI